MKRTTLFALVMAGSVLAAAPLSAQPALFPLTDKLTNLEGGSRSDPQRRRHLRRQSERCGRSASDASLRRNLPYRH